MICTFLGHGNCPDSILPKLKIVLHDLIQHQNITDFYVGNQGNFDRLVYHSLLEMRKEYPHIKCTVIIAYMPEKCSALNSSDTLLPDGNEKVPRKFAISWRNKWMLERADYVVTYITHSFGGAAKFAEMAEKKNKICINIALLL